MVREAGLEEKHRLPAGCTQPHSSLFSQLFDSAWLLLSCYESKAVGQKRTWILVNNQFILSFYISWHTPCASFCASMICALCCVQLWVADLTQPVLLATYMLTTYLLANVTQQSEHSVPSGPTEDNSYLCILATTLHYILLIHIHAVMECSLHFTQVL